MFGRLQRSLLLLIGQNDMLPRLLFAKVFASAKTTAKREGSNYEVYYHVSLIIYLEEYHKTSDNNGYYKKGSERILSA